MAARLGLCNILQCLINGNCNLDSQTKLGDTALIICTRCKHEKCLRVLISSRADLGIVNSFGHCATSTTISTHWKEYQKAVMDIVDLKQNGENVHKVMFEYALKRGCLNVSPLAEANPLHRAACYGDINMVEKLLKEGNYDVNGFDENGYTPLMLAARESNGEMCGLLISHGAKCDIKNERHETTLLLARENNSKGNDAENVIMDELARRVVLCGARVKKHTKCGKGLPHRKQLVMVGAAGILRWGKSNKRNVVYLLF